MQSFIEGETTPRQFTLYGDDEEVQDLTGATVDLILTAADGTELDTTGTLVVTTPALGLVTFTPTAALMDPAYSPLSALFRATNGAQIGYVPGDGADEWFIYPARTAYPRFTFADLRRQVLRHLDAFDEYATDSDLDELVKQQLNEANANRASEHPWSFMRADYQLAVTTGQRRYSLPGNLDKLLFIWSPTDNRYLTRIPERHIDDAGVRHDGTQASSIYQPFDVRDKTLVFFEPPRQSETLYIGYFKTPAKLVNPTDIPNIPYPHSRVLVWDALLDLKAYANELGAMGLWTRKQEQAETKLYANYLDGQTLGSLPLGIKPGLENF
jgi:hypothetical protein